MPRFEPFRGIRYDSARVDLSSVIAPPYDVIDEHERARLAGRHSANAVRIELPEPDHRAGLDRYAHAAVQFQRWLEEGVLRRDPGPTFSAYRMTTIHGHVTNGVIGALGIDDASAADILPHEETLPKAKSDRLELLRATRANLSPIWGLSMTAGLSDLFVSKTVADTRAVDDQGTVHEVWVIDDPDDLEAISTAVASSPVVVADGHHRYETARTFRSEGSQRSAHPGRPRSAEAPGAGDDLVLALIVELAEGNLEVGAIHRGLSHLPEGSDLLAAFSSWFDVTRAGALDERTVDALGEAGALALVMPSGCWLLSPKDGTPEAADADLDSSMVALVLAELPHHDVQFHNSWQDAVRAVVDGRAEAVCLLRPVTPSQIAAWAHRRRRMPPKTTYFVPKPRTGIVYRTLDDPL